MQSIQKIYFWWCITFVAHTVTNTRVCRVWCLFSSIPHPFTWHVYISTYYASLTAYIRVHPALSEGRTRHSVIWQAELKRCQHIHPRRDEFQQLTDHFVTVMEGHARILSPLQPLTTKTHTHQAASCNTQHWVIH